MRFNAIDDIETTRGDIPLIKKGEFLGLVSMKNVKTLPKNTVVNGDLYKKIFHPIDRIYTYEYQYKYNRK